MPNDVFSRYKVFRRLGLIWVALLISGATYQVFWSQVSASNEYIALLGLFTVATGFYSKWVYPKECEVENDAQK